TFGLEEIKSEVSAIQGAVFNPSFGLEEIKSEINQLLAFRGPSANLTTGPFFKDNNEQNITFKALNDTLSPQSVTFAIFDLDSCPKELITEAALLDIPSCCASSIQVGIGSEEKEIEIRAQLSTVLGILVYAGIQSGQGSIQREFKSGEWLPASTFCGSTSP
ncbi:hypothetical protein JOC37_000673, partial [Desulfohalotomaculum tongense]|nr:hypothetical protein [Desulforadius tongensis]